MSDDLIARLRMSALTSWDGDAIRKAIERIDALEAKVAEYDQTFQIMRNADMWAIKAWQKQTGKDMEWPDKAKLTGWLLDRDAESLSRAWERLLHWQQCYNSLWEVKLAFEKEHNLAPADLVRAETAERQLTEAVKLLAAIKGRYLNGYRYEIEKRLDDFFAQQEPNDA